MATDVLETKVVSMLDALQNGVIELGNQVVKYTPDVIQAVMGITVITGLQQLLYGFIWLLLFCICFVMFTKVNFKKVENCEDMEIIKFCVSVIGSILSFIGVLVQLTDVWSWVAVFQPKLYLAHQIVDKVMETAARHVN